MWSSFGWLIYRDYSEQKKRKQIGFLAKTLIDYLVQFLSDKALIQLPESSADVGSRAIKLGLVGKIAEPNTQSMHIVTQ